MGQENLRESNMYFDKPSTEPATPMATPHHEVPSKDDVPVGDQWDLERMSIGPTRPLRRGAGNPLEVVPPGIDTGISLAARLNWGLGKAAKNPQSRTVAQNTSASLEEITSPLKPSIRSSFTRASGS